MAVETDTFSADGSTAWFLVVEHPVHIAVDGSFGSGTIAVEQRIKNTTSTVRDNGTEIGITSDDNSSYNFSPGDVIRLTLSGSTSPDIDWKISGVS
jgi:hypothetical protein